MKARRRAFLGAVVTLVPAAAAQAAPAPAAEAKPADSGMAEGLLAAARARFGHELTAEEIEGVRKEIESGLRSGEALRAVSLGTADEPATLFEAAPRGFSIKR